MSALNLVVEQMLKLLIGHSLTCIFNRYLNIVGFNCCLHTYLSAVVGKLSGIVGQRVQHKQREHLVGLYHSVGWLNMKFYTFHLERFLASGQHIEQWLQGETLDV